MIVFFRFAFFLFLAVFFSCSNNRHPDFLQSKSGLYYKFFSLGGGDIPQKFDYIRIKYQMFPVPNKDQTMPLTGEKFFQLNFSDDNKHFQEALMMLNVGDSAAFVFSYKKAIGFLEMDSISGHADEILLHIKIVEIIPAEKYLQKYLKLNQWMNIKDFEEQKTLNKYLLNNNISQSCFSNGIYFISQRAGEGEMISQGMNVLLNYRGTFLNGEIFDDTYNINSKPFTFAVGTSGQVIPGLEIAVKKMKNKGKAKIIISSQLGFGEKGSSTGIIPPNTTVIYEVEILRVY